MRVRVLAYYPGRGTLGKPRREFKATQEKEFLGDLQIVDIYIHACMHACVHECVRACVPA